MREVRIYPDRESYAARLRKLESLPPAQARLIRRFIDRGAAQGLTFHRLNFYLSHLRRIAEMLGPKFERPSRKDIEALVARVEGLDLEDWTKSNYRQVLKRFYRWRLGRDQAYPDCVAWIRVKRSRNHKLPQDLLSREEIRGMIDACLNPRDRALIATLADSGCRIGEALTLRLRNVSFDEYGVVLMVSGKTGDRRVRMIGDGIAHLSAWMDVHPSKGDREAPLFVGMDKRTWKDALSYAAARKLIDSAARRAGLKKRVHPHLFRHSRASELAKRLPEAPLEQLMGWVHGSSMTKTYVHLSGRDIDRILLESAGIAAPKDEAAEKETLPKACPRCTKLNTRDARFCRQCGLPLDLETGLNLEDARTNFMISFLQLADDPGVRRILQGMIERQAVGGRAPRDGVPADEAPRRQPSSKGRVMRFQASS